MQGTCYSWVMTTNTDLATAARTAVQLPADAYLLADGTDTYGIAGVKIAAMQQAVVTDTPQYVVISNGVRRITERANGQTATRIDPDGTLTQIAADGSEKPARASMVSGLARDLADDELMTRLVNSAI